MAAADKLHRAPVVLYEELRAVFEPRHELGAELESGGPPLSDLGNPA